jgi:gamma-glutamylcyclotransferase (GGCT)/AIG2-like uncharacterized protein YtfP
VAGRGNAVAARVHARLGPGVPGVAAGRLYAIPDSGGWYPALVVGGGGLVRGWLYEAGAEFGAGDLAALDDWEGYWPEDLAASDYHRREIDVALADGSRVTAQAYVWTGALPARAEAIEAGDIGSDFAAFLVARGLRAFGEEG